MNNQPEESSMMKYARKMTKPEIILVVDWLRANIAVVDGLSYAEVGQLIVSEKVIGREVLTRDQVAGIASDWGIAWKRPGIGVCAKNELEDVIDNLGSLQKRMARAERLIMALENKMGIRVQISDETTEAGA